MDSTATTTQTTHLQGYGLAPAVQAQDLQIGHVTVWNFGYRYEVCEIAPRGKTQVVVTLVDMDGIKEYTKVMSRTRLVGLAGDI